MTTSHIAFLSEILADGPIPEDKLAYFRRRLANHVYAAVVNEFLRQERDGLTRAKLARRIRRRPEQITKWFSSSSNWTIETLSDLLLGMKCEPSVATHHLDASDVTQASSSNNVIDLPQRRYPAIDANVFSSLPIATDNQKVAVGSSYG